jgi:hypothetical protein
MNKDFLAANLRKQIGLEYEDVVIWIKKVEKVVAKKVVCKSRTRKPAGKNVVGYTTLMPDSPNNGTGGCFNRRVFFEDANGVSVDKVFAGVTL